MVDMLDARDLGAIPFQSGLHMLLPQAQSLTNSLKARQNSCGIGGKVCGDGCIRFLEVCCPDGTACAALTTCQGDGCCPISAIYGCDDVVNGCSTGYKECGDKTCAPNGAVCCGGGKYCDAGYTCGTTKCIPGGGGGGGNTVSSPPRTTARTTSPTTTSPRSTQDLNTEPTDLGFPSETNDTSEPTPTFTGNSDPSSSSSAQRSATGGGGNSGGNSGGSSGGGGNAAASVQIPGAKTIALAMAALYVVFM